MHSSTSFYQQLHSRFAFIIAIFITALAFVIVLSLYREQQLSFVMEQQYPETENIYRQQADFFSIDQRLSNIISSKRSGLLLTQYQALMTDIEQLKALSLGNNRVFDSIISGHHQQYQQLERLVENEARNDALLESILQQLELVLLELDIVQTSATENQTKLYQQIMQDKRADQVTLSRVKAYTKVTNSLAKLMQTQHIVKTIYGLFQEINLQYPLKDFDILTEGLTGVFTLWHVTSVDIDNAIKSEKKLLAALLALENLLYTEHSAIAKWRGHIRIAQEYFHLLSRDKARLQQHADKLNFPKQSIKLVPKFITEHKLIANLIKKQKLDPDLYIVSYYRWAIYALLILLILFFLVALLGLYSRIKEQGNYTLSMLKQLSSGKNIQPADNGYKDIQIAQLIAEIKQPAHNAKEYQTLLQQIKNLRQSFFEHTRQAYFSFDDKNDKSNKVQEQVNKHAQMLLFGTYKDKKNWRDAFSDQNVQTIMASAQQAKSEKKTIHLEVSTVTNNNYLITMWYRQHRWQGVIIDQAQRQYLLGKINALEEKNILLLQNNQQSMSVNTEQLSKMLINAMLQNHSVTNGSGVTSLQVYRQLSRILDWCHQWKQTSEAVEHPQVNLLRQVMFKDEFTALGNNIVVEANKQRNNVIIRFEPQLLTKGKMNLRLFHLTLFGLAKMCLFEQFKSTLILCASIADKNVGQQIVRFTFDIYSTESKSSLSKNIQALTHYCGDRNEGQGQLTHELKYMFSLFHATSSGDVQAKENDHGFQVSIDMPISLIDSEKVDKSHQVNLKQAHFIILSQNNLLTSQLTQNIKQANGRAENIKGVKQLIEQLNAKQLKIQPIATVIISDEYFKTEYKIIEQHLCSLPKPMQPKLMVLQAQFNNVLHREGLYQHSEFLDDESYFIERLADFIASTQNNNLAIAPEIFKQYRFEPTQVEILIGVHQPKKHQQLSRLLHWLGLQVHFVCQSQVMLKDWQSGRYLILLTDFSLSPLVEMQVGKNVHRGVFTFSPQDFLAINEATLSATKHWSQGTLPTVLDVDDLIKLLSPWLKEKYAAVETETVNEVNMKHDSILENRHLPRQIDENQAFDLFAFARNQGSPELAVFMLDGYIDEINDDINGIAKALTNKNFKQAAKHNVGLFNVSTIIAANEISKLSQKLTATLDEKSLKKSQAISKELIKQNQHLVEYAQAI